MRRLKNTFTGKAGERIPHDFLNCLANFYNDFNVVGGGFMRRDDGKHTTVIIPRTIGDDLQESFLITDTDGTVCTMEPGSFYRDTAQKTIIDLPGTIQCGSAQIGTGTILATWLQYDTRLGTCQWMSGTVTATSSGTIEIYPVHKIQSDGTNIGTIHHEHPANFHISGDDLQASFLIINTDGTVCTMEPGSFYRDTAQKTIIDLPGTIQCAGTTLATWLQYDTDVGTCQWKSGTVTASSSGTIEVYPVHRIQSDGTNIGTIHHEHPANFHTFSPPGTTETTGTWQDMGTSAEHADSAASDTWTNNGTKGLKFTCSVDLGYDHTAGTPRLYAVKRIGTWDLYGNLLSKGVETIVEIDQPISHALLGT
jgi:hypothetical protein